MPISGPVKAWAPKEGGIYKLKMRKSKKNYTLGQNFMSSINGKSVAIYVLKNLPFLQIFISQPNSEKNTKNPFSKNAYFNLAPRKMDL